MEPFWMNFGFSPLKGFGRLVVDLDERVDGGTQLGDAGKAAAP